MKQVRIGDDEWVKGAWKHGFMEFIHTVNRLCDERGEEPVFGEPTFLGDWWVSGYYVEQYPRARVIFKKKAYRDGSGFRIVTDDEALFGMWDEASAIVLPKLEVRAEGRPSDATL